MAAAAWGGVGGGGWGAAAPVDAAEDADEAEKERERDLEAINKRFNEWAQLQMQIHLSHAQRRDLLRAMALKLST